MVQESGTRRVAPSGTTDREGDAQRVISSGATSSSGGTCRVSSSKAMADEGGTPLGGEPSLWDGAPMLAELKKMVDKNEQLRLQERLRFEA
ncbi:hypothetical protein GN244_ATG04467 [Phytophthora infestans]|uniref:Uncharacterized protein n=1 Tax=Phytophthora infestans TaxID=4787 RepID=A0A833S9C2_PHYIN|nr:hypothetical protein GN244_ATG04467 [Phytophthora infestans]